MSKHAFTRSSIHNHSTRNVLIHSYSIITHTPRHSLTPFYFPSADYFHFQTLHRPVPMPLLERFMFGRHSLKARYFDDANKDASEHHVREGENRRPIVILYRCMCCARLLVVGMCVLEYVYVCVRNVTCTCK